MLHGKNKEYEPIAGRVGDTPVGMQTQTACHSGLIPLPGTRHQDVWPVAGDFV